MSLASFAFQTQTSGGSSGLKTSVHQNQGSRRGRRLGKVTPPSGSFHPSPPKQSRTTRLGSTSQPSTGRRSQREPRILAQCRTTQARSNVPPETSEECNDDQTKEYLYIRCCRRAVLFQHARNGAASSIRYCKTPG